MIRNITQGTGIHISQGGYSAPYIDTSRPSAGLVRYNNGNFEIYDGSSWMIIQSSFPQVSLDSEVIGLLDWVRKKRQEEAELQQLALQHPTLQSALETLQHAQEQVKIVAALVKQT